MAVCTPNHSGAKLAAGDWVAGFLGKKRQNHFLYAMELSEGRVHMDAYFRRPEFQAKKPDLTGDWMQRSGDNFYRLGPDGRTWQQHWNRYHRDDEGDDEHCRRDTRHPYVFVAKKFWYLGKYALRTPLPPGFLPLVPTGKGIRTNHDPELVQQFCDWVRVTFPEGRRDDPLDNLDLNDNGLLNISIPPSSPCGGC
jgi:hypothetical protein